MKLNHQLYFYSFLAHLRLLEKNYPTKIMFVAFVGTHVPLLTLLLSFLISNSYSLEMEAQVLVIALLATLTGTTATLHALRHLLAPVILTSAALQDYLNTKTLPELPTAFANEAGTLTANTSQTLYKLHGALERNEIQIYYQPLIDLHTRQITAVEALIRWQHPTWGLVPPAKFIPIAEASGLIVPIGEWVLRTACAQNRAWQLAGLSPIRISVNLSARQFEQPNLLQIVSQILQETGLQASYLELEVTESLLIADIERSVKTLKQLQELGIWLALDDFGTGYSSLNYLKRFPFNMLKIDRSFVHDIVSNPDSAAVTDAIIALAKSLRLNITAEGVETQEQLKYLEMRGCHEGQGFYFSPAVPADTIFQMLKQSSQQKQTIAV